MSQPPLPVAEHAAGRGGEVAPWNAKVMDGVDPFGDHLCFDQPL
jgi:hypothetical protein